MIYKTRYQCNVVDWAIQKTRYQSNIEAQTIHKTINILNANKQASIKALLHQLILTRF